jgi:hypothetical protein
MNLIAYTKKHPTFKKDLRKNIAVLVKIYYVNYSIYFVFKISVGLQLTSFTETRLTEGLT